MSEREELATTILAYFHPSPYAGESWRLDPTSAADVILAAGYRRPRTITTVEELEALPDLSVILDVDRDVSQLRGRSWCGYEMADLTHPMMAKCLPATVLYEPLP